MVGFVVLNYCAYRETIKCVKTIKKIIGEKKIIIVDNNSPNHSYDILKDKYQIDKDILILKNNKNEGFAIGNNLGYSYLKQNYNCEFIIVMNNDMEIKDVNFIKKINKAYLDDNFYIMGPDIFSTKAKKHQNPEKIINYSQNELKKILLKLKIKKYFSFLYKIKKKFFHKEKNEHTSFKNKYDYKEKKYNVVLHGSCYIFSHLFIQKEDICFYPKTFMYFESYILHYLSIKKGYKMVYNPIVQVLHHEDATTDLLYSKSFEKFKFLNNCLIDSCVTYLKLIKKGE